MLAQEPAQHREEPGDHGGRVHDLGRQHRAAAEGEQLAHERRRTLDGPEDLVQVGPGRRPGVELGRHELAVAAHDREEVVEVVGDAAGELADRLQPLRLQQAVLRARARAVTSRFTAT